MDSARALPILCRLGFWSTNWQCRSRSLCSVRVQGNWRLEFFGSHNQGHWAGEGGGFWTPLQLFGALQSQMCLQGKCSWRASNNKKSLRKFPPCVYKQNLVGERPPTTKVPPKVPPMTTLRRPPWVKWHPPSPSPKEGNKMYLMCIISYFYLNVEIWAVFTYLLLG